MSNAAKIAVPLLLLAAIGGGVAYISSQGGEVPQGPVTPPPVTTPAPAPDKPVEPAVAPTPAPAPVIERSDASTDAAADAPQGVRGRVLLPTGAPAAGIPVMLLESMSNDPLAVFLINRSANKTRPPLVNTETAADGTFSLGIRQLGKAVDLRVVSAEHPEFAKQQIKLRDGDWYDIGDIALEQGLAVQGRVLDADTKAPIANATVWMIGSQQSHMMVATPGRERGTPATTDGAGSFRFLNAPRTGLVNLLAEAQGYASTQILNKQLSTESANEVSLELDLGQPIAGIVVDPNGVPVAGAIVNANGLSAKTPQQSSATTGADGVFEFPTLRPGPYQLVASSTRYADVKQPLVLTGDVDVKIVVSTKGSAKIRVLAANGAAVRNFHVSLRRHHPNNPMAISRVPDYPDRSITPADYREFNGEWAALGGLPSGEFCLQITDNAHAKTLSPPFTIVEGGDPVEVVTKLTMGAVITGTVIDDRGQPVAGATITTDMNGGIAADSGLWEMLRSMMPERHTKSSARTDEQGRFRITKLAFADYMVRAAHPDYCEETAVNLKLENEGQVTDAGVIQLMRGAIVEGSTLVGGLPAGQIKVALSLPMKAEALPGAQRGGNAPGTAPPPPPKMFNANVFSAGDGTYRMTKRVPPGTYKINASRQGTGSPFDTLLDIKETDREVTIAPGQEVVHVDFALTKR